MFTGVLDSRPAPVPSRVQNLEPDRRWERRTEYRGQQGWDKSMMRTMPGCLGGSAIQVEPDRKWGWGGWVKEQKQNVLFACYISRTMLGYLHRVINRVSIATL